MFNKLKNFYLDNMKLIHKFLLNQIAIGLFGFMVIISTSMMSQTAMIIATVCAALFFCALLYDGAWEEGARDRNRILNGRLKKRPFHGAAVALFAYIPSMLFVIPSVVLTLISLAGVSAVDGVLTVFTTISLFVCNGMYLGFSWMLAGAMPKAYPLFFLLYFIPAVFAYFLGYYLGTEDVQIKTFFGMKPTTGDPSVKKRK